MEVLEVGEGVVSGFVTVDSFRFGRRQHVVVQLFDGRRWEAPASQIRVLSSSGGEAA